MRLYIPFVLAGVLIAGCRDDPVEPVYEGPLFSVEVVDSAGAPVEGLEVGRVNHPSYGEKMEPTPSTTIDFSLPVGGLTTVKVHDYYGRVVEVLLDNERLDGGNHSLLWNTDVVRWGYYRYALRFVPDTGEVANAEMWMVVEGARDTVRCKMGLTDSEGIWATDDTLWFPCLPGNPPEIPLSDEEGNPLSIEGDFYHDSITIIIRDTAMTREQRIETPLVVGRNQFKFVWPWGNQ